MPKKNRKVGPAVPIPGGTKKGPFWAASKGRTNRPGTVY